MRLIDEAARLCWPNDCVCGAACCGAAAHPAGNITRVSADIGLRYFAKWIELLKELVPKLSSIFSLHRNRFGKDALGLQCWLRRANVHSATSRNFEED
jgi:hypothetical protein